MPLSWQEAFHIQFCSSNQSQILTLPEWEEDDGLDGEELEYWIEGPQQILGGEVEQEQRVEGQGDADVVHDRDVEVAKLHAVRWNFVGIGTKKYDIPSKTKKP